MQCFTDIILYIKTTAIFFRTASYVKATFSSLELHLEQQHKWIELHSSQLLEIICYDYCQLLGNKTHTQTTVVNISSPLKLT